jgi:hypothetical protein
MTDPAGGDVSCQNFYVPCVGTAAVFLASQRQLRTLPYLETHDFALSSIDQIAAVMARRVSVTESAF